MIPKPIRNYARALLTEINEGLCMSQELYELKVQADPLPPEIAALHQARESLVKLIDTTTIAHGALEHLSKAEGVFGYYVRDFLEKAAITYMMGLLSVTYSIVDELIEDHKDLFTTKGLSDLTHTLYCVNERIRDYNRDFEKAMGLKSSHDVTNQDSPPAAQKDGEETDEDNVEEGWESYKMT